MSVAHGRTTSGKKKTGKTKSQKQGMHYHAIQHGKISKGAERDPWGHKGQAKGQG